MSVWTQGGAVSFEWGLEQERDLEQVLAVQAAGSLCLSTGTPSNPGSPSADRDTVQNPGRAQWENHSAGSWSARGRLCPPLLTTALRWRAAPSYCPGPRGLNPQLGPAALPPMVDLCGLWNGSLLCHLQCIAATGRVNREMRGRASEAGVFIPLPLPVASPPAGPDFTKAPSPTRQPSPHDSAFLSVGMAPSSPHPPHPEV